MPTKKTPLFIVDEDAPFDLQFITPRMLEMRHPDDDLDPMTGMMRQQDAERLLGLSGRNIDMDPYGEPWADGTDYLNDAYYERDMFVPLVDPTGSVDNHEDGYRDSYGPGSIDNIGQGMGELTMQSLKDLSQLRRSIGGLQGTFKWLDDVESSCKRGEDPAQFGLSGAIDSILSRVKTIKDRVGTIATQTTNTANNTVNMANNIYNLWQTVKSWIKIIAGYWDTLKTWWTSAVNYYGYAKGKVEAAWTAAMAKFDEIKKYLLDVKNRFATFVNEASSQWAKMVNYFALVQTDVRNLKSWATTNFNESVKAVKTTLGAMSTWLKTANSNIVKLENFLRPMSISAEGIKGQVDAIKAEIGKFSPENIEKKITATTERLDKILGAFEEQSVILSSVLGKFDELIGAVQSVSFWGE